MNPELFPILNLFSLDELQRMALHTTLMQHGVEDPVQYLENHTVEFKCVLKGNVGLTLVITKSTPKSKPNTKSLENQ